MTIILGYSCPFLFFLAPARCEIVADDEKMHTRTITGSFVSTKFVLSCMPLFISLSKAWFVIRADLFVTVTIANRPRYQLP